LHLREPLIKSRFRKGVASATPQVAHKDRGFSPWGIFRGLNQTFPLNCSSFRPEAALLPPQRRNLLPYLGSSPASLLNAATWLSPPWRTHAGRKCCQALEPV